MAFLRDVWGANPRYHRDPLGGAQLWPLTGRSHMSTAWAKARCWRGAPDAHFVSLFGLRRSA